MPATKKVAILGGGLGGLSTAFFLTSDPDWKDKYESITLYQMGWRLGGKCASSRNPHQNNRIEEHGIHLFGGFYYNAFAMMKAVYDELERPPGAPLQTIDKAFRANNASTMWENLHRRWYQWPTVQKSSDRKPWDADLDLNPAQMLAGAFRSLTGLIMQHLDSAKQAQDDSFWHKLVSKNPLVKDLEKRLKRFQRHLDEGRELDEKLLGILLTELKKMADWMDKHFGKWIDKNDDIRRALLMLDYMLTMFTGFINDKVYRDGFDQLDGEDYKAWLERHGARPETMASPLPVLHPNILFAYLNGDASRPPTMAAGAFLHWSFLSFSEPGAYSWMFAAGTGETLIAPIYEALRDRGVKFEFFHKVKNLSLNSGGDKVSAITFDIQATTKEGHPEYQPLTTDPGTGLIGWPHRPHYEQLQQGEELRRYDESGEPELESYWNSWPGAGEKTLQEGQDFDEVVMALSIGALPDTCSELIDASEKWQAMIANVPAIQTQAFQIWLKEPINKIARHVPDSGTDVFIGANYMAPASAFAEMSHLEEFEGWPEDIKPGACMYFCGAMPEDPTPPPYSDHSYPARQYERVKWQSAQLLQAAASPMLPGATVRMADSWACGDPSGLDFSLLNPTAAGSNPAIAFQAIDDQFFRANIDPTERYVLSPPGSTEHRIAPGDSGFSNLALAGDWTRNGLNVGCVEATVMSGQLAACAISEHEPVLRGNGLGGVPGVKMSFNN